MDSTGIIIEVGMADMKVAVGPAVIVTRGLGSCLVIVISFSGNTEETLSAFSMLFMTEPGA